MNSYLALHLLSLCKRTNSRTLIRVRAGLGVRVIVTYYIKVSICEQFLLPVNKRSHGKYKVNERVG